MACAIGLTACTGEPNNTQQGNLPDDTQSDLSHTRHTFDKQVAESKYLYSEATCDKPAYYLFSCKCGETGTELFIYGSPKGHVEVEDKAKAPTCTEKGITAGKHCSVCSTITVMPLEVSATGHNYENGVCQTCGEAEPPTEGLRYNLNSDGKSYYVSQISWIDGRVKIAAEYNGLPVTAIGDAAFGNCGKLTSIVIPDSVTSIGDAAFGNCSGLTIYCEVAEQPGGWDSYWNIDNLPVVWNCKNN